MGWAFFDCADGRANHKKSPKIQKKGDSPDSRLRKQKETAILFAEVGSMSELDKKKFGTFVSELRKEKGMTQKDLAQQLFLSDKAVSKWETGVNIPDTAILMPLAELLGVSVTELLMCERLPDDDTMNPEQVEGLVQTAIRYADEPAKRAWQVQSPWRLWYLLSVLLGGAALAVCLLRTGAPEMVSFLLTPVILGIVFGAYFCYGAAMTLPPYYDQYKINGLYDGPFRMHVPGLRFSNRNWPHIVTVGRIWSCATTVGIPLLTLLAHLMRIDRQMRIVPAVLTVVSILGLFVSIYAVGKKYES